MKRMKRALALILSMLMLCSTVATNVVFASAETADPAAVISVESDSGDTDDLVSADESGNTLLKAGDNSSIQEVNEATTVTVSENNESISETEDGLSPMEEGKEVVEFYTGRLWSSARLVQITPGSTAEIEYLGQATYGGRLCGIFTVNGQRAFCMEHPLYTPDYGGNPNTGIARIYDNALIRTILYYTDGGPGFPSGPLAGKSLHEVIVRTSFALNYAYTGEPNIPGEAGKQSGLVLAQDLLNFCNANLITTTDVAFSQTNVEGYYDGDIQRTPNITLNADKRNSVSFTLPAGILIHFNDTNTDKTGTVTVKGGQSFYLFMDASANIESYSTGSLAGTMGDYQPLLIDTGASLVQEIGLLCEYKSDSRTSLNVTWLNQAKVSLKKESADPSVTNGNSCYSLENAVYGVYSDRACTVEQGTLTTDANGESNVLSLPIGTYYVKEKEAPKGFYLDSKVYTVRLTADYSTEPYVLEVKDRPTMDPVTILLKKVDADTGENIPQNTGTLAGAEFTVKYYDVDCNGINPEELGETPERSWIFKTDEDGFSFYESEFLVSGDALYVSANGLPSIPAGTITIQETKAPEGFLINDEVFVIGIVPGEAPEDVTSYAVPIVPENSFKLNLKKIEIGTDKAIPGAVFEHIRPNGEAETLTTDEKGELSFIGMEYGEHTITEVSAPDGYAVNGNEIKFTVHEDNTVTVNSEAVVTDTDGNVTISIGDDGNINVVVEDKPAPYSLLINKKNNKDQSLPGAEFTLFADESCTQVIDTKETDVDGKITFDNLIVGEKYYLQETKAPKGYLLPEEAEVYEIYAESSPVDGIFDFYVNGEKFTTENTDINTGIYLSGTVADRIVNMEVINDAGMLLPETGSSMTIVLCLVGAALMIGVLLVNKNKKSKE